MNRSELSPGYIVQEAEDVDTEEVVLATLPRYPSLQRALESVRQAAADLHAASGKVPMPCSVAINDMLRELAEIELRLEHFEGVFDAQP